MEYGYEGTTPKVYIDEGISVLRRKFLQDFPKGITFPLKEIFKKLIEQHRLKALETHQRFYEIGSKRGLEEFIKLVEEGVIS